MRRFDKPHSQNAVSYRTNPSISRSRLHCDAKNDVHLFGISLSLWLILLSHSGLWVCIHQCVVSVSVLPFEAQVQVRTQAISIRPLFVKTYRITRLRLDDL